jgi:hypothetical protein
MVAVLDSSPVSSNQVDPAFVGALVAVLTGEIVSSLRRGLAGSFGGAAALNADEGPGERKIDRQGLDFPQD